MAVVNNAFVKCQSIYDAEFVPALKQFNAFPPRRHKRQAALLGAVGGYVLSNILHTVEEKLSGDGPDRVLMIKNKLADLNAKFDLQILINEVEKAQLAEIDTWLRATTIHLNEMASEVPELTVVASYIMYKILSKIEHFNRLHISIRQNRPDFVTLGEILRMDTFGRMYA